MNNAISRLIEAEATAPEQHAGKHWWEELSPEKQEEYLRKHPGSSKEEKQSTDVVPHGKKGNDAEPGKPAKKPSTDVVQYSEKPVTNKGNGHKGNEPGSGKKPGTDVVPKGRRNDDITDVDFTETPRSKEAPKLNGPEKKSTDVAPANKPKWDAEDVDFKDKPKSTSPKQLDAPQKKHAPKVEGPKDTPKLKDSSPKWGAEDVDFKEEPRGEKKESPKLEGPKSEPKSDKPAETKPAPKLEHQPDKEYKVNEPAPKKPSGDSPKAPPKSPEAPKDKAPEKKADSPKPAPKSEPKSEPKKPSAVDRIQEDEAEEKSAKDRAEDRKDEKHEHQMEVLRRKEAERLADREEKKRKDAEKDAEKKGKEPAAKPEEKRPSEKPGEKKSDKKDDKKSEKKVEKKQNTNDKRGGEKPGSPGSRSDPAAEQHKPNSMPNEEGGPNPHGGDSGAGGAVNRLKESGGDFSPVPPSGKPTSPSKPISPKAPPGAPDDNDVTFEDEPNTSKGPESQSNQESTQPSSGPNGFESEQPGGGEANPGLGGENPSSMSESPNVEEKPGNMSEGVDVDQTPSGEAIPFEQQDEMPSEPVAPEAGPDHDANPGEKLESPEQAPSDTSEPAPEGERQPSPEAPKFGEQNEPSAPVPGFENSEPPVEAPAPMQPQQDNIPDAAPQTPDFSDPLKTPDAEKEDMGQSSPGFGGGGAPGAIPLDKSGGGSAPSGGPKSDGGNGGMPGQTSQPSMRDERGQPAQPYQMKSPGGSPDKSMPSPGQPQPEGQQQPGGGVPTKPNSPARTQSADVIRNQAQNIAQRLMKDAAGVPKGLAAMYNIMNGRGTAQDGHAAVALLGNILGSAAAMAATGAGGPLGFATFMAIKHAGVPAMVAIVKKAFAGGMPTVNPEHQQEELTRLVQSAADYAQEGNIPAEAWHRGVAEAKQQGG